MFHIEYLFLIWTQWLSRYPSIQYSFVKNLQKVARRKTAKKRHFRDKKSESQFPQDRLVVNFDRSLLSSWLPLCVQCKEWAQGVVQVCQTSENARHCFLKASPKILPMFKNNIEDGKTGVLPGDVNNIALAMFTAHSVRFLLSPFFAWLMEFTLALDPPPSIHRALPSSSLFQELLIGSVLFVRHFVVSLMSFIWWHFCNGIII